MALVNFVRKAVNIHELKEAAKKPGISQYSSETIIELSEEEYNYFADNLLEDFDFISKHKEKMYTDINNVWHCILIKAKGAENGILIESEGYDYARYSAYLI
ncbi:MAG: DUF6329 domain-containing protein [Eubacteriaceae bacterium]